MKSSGDEDGNGHTTMKMYLLHRTALLKYLHGKYDEYFTTVKIFFKF
jgi:hypothetical protein